MTPSPPFRLLLALSLAALAMGEPGEQAQASGIQGAPRCEQPSLWGSQFTQSPVTE